MSRAVPDLPGRSDAPSTGDVTARRPDNAASAGVSEQDMHAEHIAALETTLFRKHQPTLVLALESGRLRVLSRSPDRSNKGEQD